MQKHKYLLSRNSRISLIVLSAIIAAIFIINRLNMRNGIHGQYFTTQTIRELENLGIIVRNLEELENSNEWVFNEENGLYELENYQIHPQVISEATYDSTMEATNWRYPHITGSDGYHWVLTHRIKPLVDSLEKLYLQYPKNIELLTFFESELYKANVIINTFGEEYDDNLIETKAWLEKKNLVREPSGATGWEEVHPGVWHREIAIDDEATKHTWRTENPEARKWYVENILKPRYDKAVADLAELGEEEAQRQGIYYEILSVIELYKANLEIVELDAQE